MKAAKATALASALGGQVVSAMPQSRLPGITLTRADGRFVSIEGDETEWGCGYVFPSRQSYERYHYEGFQGTIPDSADWHRWGVNQEWAEALAALLRAEAYQSGGNTWIVRYERPDGRFAVIGDDGAEIYRNRDHYERYYD